MFSLSASAVSPSLNGRIAFTSSRDGDSEIYTMRSDGTDLQKLTDNAFSDSIPKYSPDGTKITFTSNRDGNQEVYVMDADGGNQTRLTNVVGNDFTANWSPDGSKLTFTSDRDGNSEIYTMDADGSNQVNITNNPANDGYSDWSVNNQITFRSMRDHANSEVYTVDQDGTNVVRLTNNSFNDTVPGWSPDGSTLVFYSNRDGNLEVYTMLADGTNQTRITTNSASDNNADFIADGSKIIFQSNRDGNNEMYVMDVDGANQERLTNDLGDDSRPGSQPLTITPTTLDSDVTLDATSGSVVYDALANHEDVYEGMDPSTVAITSEPAKGTATVDTETGEITYDPNDISASKSSVLTRLMAVLTPPVYAQSTDTDSFTYQICSLANEELCTTNTVSVQIAVSEEASMLADTGTSRHPIIAIAVSLMLLAFLVIGIKTKFIGI